MNRRHWSRLKLGMNCRACFFKKATHSHHVTYEKELDARGLPLYDRRNFMALCNDCHYNHHHGQPENKLPLVLLTDDNIAYAYEVLGPAAYDYLRRKYSGDDHRVMILEEVA